MKSSCQSYFPFAAYKAVYIVILALLIISCKGRNENTINKNLITDSLTIKSAKGFYINRYKDYSIVTIMNPWQGAEGIKLVYYLVKKGSPLPEGITSEQIISVPLKSIVCMSTTYAGMITALGESNSLTGLSTADFAYSEEISDRVKKGVISEVGYEMSLNYELIIKISPDLVMMYGIGSESAGHINKLRELGINIMFNGDYLEVDPLAKAEWIKLFGALYCKEKLADSIYNAEVKAYNTIRDFVNENSSQKPAVLLGLPFKDTWYISPGNSFVSKLIGDAGGNYLWKKTASSVSMPYGLENVYIAAMNADYWLNIGTVKNSGEITVVDKRLADLECFRSGNLYNNNKRVTDSGGNDYWESGAVWPHIILKDIASILHPELFPEYELYFYQKIN
ncbi:MAG: ABC transporter substrate-binding protein [Bacteroidetes bacterium]|nr:ABC transporter substrate-binding protein [Bacteroidota bacterium]